MSAVNLRHLEAFLAIIEARSISRAAVQIGVAQSVLSRQLSAFERELGCPLFRRTGRGVVATEAALRLAPRLRRSLEDMREATLAAAQDGAQPSGDVRIGMMPAVARPLASALVRRIARTHPRIRLHFLEAFTGHLHDGLLAGSVDLAIVNRYASRASHGEISLGRVDSLVVGPADSPHLRRPDISFREMSDLPFVLPSRPNGLRPILEQAERQAGISLRIAVESDSLSVIKELARRAGLYTVLSHHAVWEELASGQLSAARLIKPGIERSISMVVTGNERNSPAIRVVAREIRRLVTTELLPGVWARPRGL